MKSNDNYIMIDGAKIPISKETYEAIRDKILEQNKNDEFDRVDKDQIYYFNSSLGVSENRDIMHIYDNTRYERADYFQKKETAKHVNKMQELQRQLYRFSMQNGGKKVNFHTKDAPKFGFNVEGNGITVLELRYYNNPCEIYFTSKEIAHQAIEKFLPLIEEVYQRKLTIRR